MSTTTTTNDTLPETAAAAVTEATRIAAEAARRSTETAKTSLDNARDYVDKTSTLGRDVAGTWSAQSEAALKAAFDAQNAALDAGLGLFDRGAKDNRKALEQFSDLVRQTQQAALETWQASVKAAAKTVEFPKR